MSEHISKAAFLTSWRYLWLSKISAISLKDLAKEALITVFNSEGFNEEPNILNSNLFPVKAIGDVLFRSELSFGSSLMESKPKSVKPLFT